MQEHFHAGRLQSAFRDDISGVVGVCGVVSAVTVFVLSRVFFQHRFTVYSAGNPDCNLFYIVHLYTLPKTHLCPYER